MVHMFCYARNVVAFNLHQSAYILCFLPVCPWKISDFVKLAQVLGLSSPVNVSAIR